MLLRNSGRRFIVVVLRLLIVAVSRRNERAPDGHIAENFLQVCEGIGEHFSLDVGAARVVFARLDKRSAGLVEVVETGDERVGGRPRLVQHGRRSERNSAAEASAEPQLLGLVGSESVELACYSCGQTVVSRTEAMFAHRNGIGARHARRHLGLLVGRRQTWNKRPRGSRCRASVWVWVSNVLQVGLATWRKR